MDILSKILKPHPKSLLLLAANSVFCASAPHVLKRTLAVRFSKNTVFASLQRNFRRGLRFLIRFYQLVFSPILGVNCRFTPSCSHYACEAISAHGAIKGSFLACKRILCCQPFSKRTGYDPVPSINSKIKA